MRVRLLAVVATLAMIIGLLWLFHDRGPYETERRRGYYTVTTPAGDVVFRTSLRVSPGDEYIDSDNRHYRVYWVEGNRAVARPVTGAGFPSDSPAAGRQEAIPFGARPRLISIYHTHSDESYEPTSGTASEFGNGDIFEVGRALAAGLRDQGFVVEQSFNRHDPHDFFSYDRSRRTAFQLLKKGPVAILDVHRDGAPPWDYRITLDGQRSARIMIVVGRQNPIMSANLQVAQRLKAVADSNFPGLIRGLFLARWDYNQDLDPAALLLEIGTSTQSLSEAEVAAGFMARVIGIAFGAPGQ